MWLQLAAAVGEQLFNEVIVDSFIPKDKSVEAILDHVTPQLRELLTNDDLKANVDKPATVTDSPPAASPRDASEVAPKVEYAAYNAVVEAPQGADSALYSAPPAVFKQVAIACLFDVLFLLRVASKCLAPLRITAYSKGVCQNGRKTSSRTRSWSAQNNYHIVSRNNLFWSLFA